MQGGSQSRSNASWAIFAAGAMALIGLLALAQTFRDLAKVLDSKSFSSSFSTNARSEPSTVNLGNDRFAVVDSNGVQVFAVDKAGRLKRLDDVNCNWQVLIQQERSPVRNEHRALPKAARPNSAAGVNSGHGNH
jgi:hypothetical protein